jgi:tRNA nucleotidyltransferase (CCA-adding enzyme)
MSQIPDRRNGERVTGPTFDGPALLARLPELPGGRELLELAASQDELERLGGQDDVELVGGAVRDLALGRVPRELDVVVGRDAHAFARELAGRLGTLAGRNERFGTALVTWEADGVERRIDVATRRAERYPAPGALPEVSEGTPQQDLDRRDFTINAIALGLTGPTAGGLRPVNEHALADLAGGRLRVLHDRSFIDDPTRLLRLARYSARLGFEIEPHTAGLAAQAVSGRALDTVSRARIGAELRLALAEADACATLAAIDQLGLLRALDPRLRFDAELAREALGLLRRGLDGEGGRPDLLLLAALLLPLIRELEDDAEDTAYALLDALEFPAADRDLALGSAIDADALAEDLSAAETPSQIRDAVSQAAPESVALAGAWALHEWEFSDVVYAAEEWLSQLRHVRLQITGEDLLAAGIPEGPEIGRRLEAALALKLDDELDESREAELKAALEA